MTGAYDNGPFDFIGDVHGCIDELTALLAKLGYDASLHHAEGRRAFFLGDLVNRGPDAPGVLRLVMAMLASGDALAVAGNHDVFLHQALTGGTPDDPAATATSVSQLGQESPVFRQDVVDFLASLPVNRIVDGGRVVAAHAGLPEALQGLDTPEARRFAVYDERIVDAEGRTVRDQWARDYRGARKVVHGHVPNEDPQWLNRTLDIDTGCVYGGRLTALRYPELQIVAVPAARVYFETHRTPGLVAAARAYRY